MQEKLQTIRPLRTYRESVIGDWSTRGGVPDIPIPNLSYLNNALWGFRRGTLVVLGARTSQGKSSFAGQLAFDIANSGKRVLFLSMETTVEEMYERLFCTAMNVSNEDVKRGNFNTDAEIRVKEEQFYRIINDIDLLITCGVGETFEEVLYMVETMEDVPDIIFIDYIQCIKTNPRTAREDINEYIRKFRQLAIERKFCGVLVSQINREATQTKSHRPSMSQLKGTGVLEEHSDVCLLLHWDFFYTREKSDKSNFDVIVAKNKTGKTGVTNLHFIPEMYKFVEHEYELKGLVKDVF